jgi:cytochrome c
MKLAKLTATAALLVLVAACGKKTEGPAPGTAETAPPAAPGLSGDAAKTALASLPAPYNTADPENGQRKFGQCRSCHSIEQGGPNMTGPNLWGVLGRKAGTEAGYSYSDGLKAAGWTWDAPRLDAWIKNPRAVLPDTKMTFLGIKNDKDRADIIAFIRLQNSK